MNVNDLEDKIMKAWETADDVDALLHRYLSSEGPPSREDISNTLRGIKTLHHQRCQKLWDAFQKVFTNVMKPQAPKFDSNGIREEPKRRLPDDEQRRLDSMGLEGLRSG